MTVNHPALMRPASFRGVPFEVETDKLTDHGRHVVVHEYVKAETYATEDLGRRAGRVKLTAYLGGDDAYARRDALVEACSAPGPAMLVLPTGRARLCRCISVGTSDERSKQGYVAVELEFVEAGSSIGPVGFPIGDRIVASALAALPALLGSAVARRSDWTAAPRDVLQATAVNAVALMETVRASVVLDPEPAAELFAALQDLSTAVEELAGAEATADWIARSATVAADISEAADPEQAAPAWRIATTDAPALVPRTKSPALSRSIAPPARGAAAFEATALCEFARTQASRAYPDRQSADAARTALDETAAIALPRIGAALGEDVYALCSDAVATASAHIAAVALDLKPVIVAETAITIPSTLAAWALYGDASRARDIVYRNRVATPLMLPRRFEALGA